MKTETIAEFLARGGKIVRVAPAEDPSKIDTVKLTPTTGPVSMMSMGEADLYYGEHKKQLKKPKTKATADIDLSALPEALRKKYVDTIIDAKQEEQAAEVSSEENFDDSED